jgi:hypothetical protein
MPASSLKLSTKPFQLRIRSVTPTLENDLLDIREVEKRSRKQVFQVKIDIAEFIPPSQFRIAIDHRPMSIRGIVGFAARFEIEENIVSSPVGD